MDREETICAIVVTYNQKGLLMECLDSLLNQTYPLDAVYLIDNASNDGTPKVLREKGYIEEILTSTNELLEGENIVKIISPDNQHKKVKLHYVRMRENTGGAGGFYEGVKRAYEKGYDWLWLMDEDCKAVQQCLENLLKYARKNIILSPMVLDEKGQTVWLKTGINDEVQQISCLPFNGFFMHSKLISQVGYPMRELFIYGDDLEYSYRMTSHGYNLFVVRNAIMIHPLRNRRVKRTLVIFGRALLYHVDIDKQRLHYYLRNRFLFFILYLRFETVIEFSRESLSILIFSRERFIYLKEVFSAFFYAIKLRIQLSENTDYRI